MGGISLSINLMGGLWHCYTRIITGWWFQPSENISQLEWLFPIYGKIKVMFQTTNQLWDEAIWDDPPLGPSPSSPAGVSSSAGVAVSGHRAERFSSTKDRMRPLSTYRENGWCWNLMVMFKKMDDWLVVSTPLKNISQMGWLFQIYRKINMFQSTYQMR